MNYKIAFYIMTIILMVFCIIWWRTPDAPATYVSGAVQKASKLRNNYLSKGALASSAISFIDGKATIIDNTSGEIVPPCKEGLKFISKEKIHQYSDKSLPSENVFEEKGCNLEIVDIDPKLLASLEASKSIITGSVLKNGVKTPAKFVVQVTALYKGSIFYWVFAGGVWHRIEISDADFCPSMSKALFESKNIMSEQEYNGTKSFLESMGCVISS